MLLDERDMAPAVGVELARIVVRVAAERDAVLRHHVPLLARDLARLAADAHRRVGEEAHARLDLEAVSRVTVSRHGATPRISVARTRAAAVRGECRKPPP